MADDRLEGKLREQVEEILRNARAHQLSTAMASIFQRVMVPLEERGFEFFRQQKKELQDEVVCWSEVLKAMGVADQDRSAMLVGIALHATYDGLVRREKGGIL